MVNVSLQFRYCAASTGASPCVPRTTRSAVLRAKCLAPCLLLILALPWLLTRPVQARQLALLIGIGHYRDAAIPHLEGPPNDVAALQQVLTERWGFRPQDLRTLVDGQATRAAILAGIDALATDSQPGDAILIYFSGHGTSPQDPGAEGLPLPHGSGALTAWDSAIDAPPDQVVASLIVGRTDLKPRLGRLDQGQRQVFVALDACYSANATRGLYRSLIGAPSAADLPTRYLPLRPPPGFDLGAYGTGRAEAPPPYPYAQVLTLAAAGAGEPAQDIGTDRLSAYPTIDGRPHGAFTDALLRVLSGRYPADRNRDGVVSYLELRDAIDHQLRAGGFGHRPQVFPPATEDGSRLAERALFGRAASGWPGPSAAPEVPDLPVRLVGSAQGLATTLGALPGVTVVESGADLVIAPVPAGWLLANPGGDKIGSAADTVALTARVRQLAWFHWLSWRSAKNPFRLALDLAESGRGSIRRPGDFIHLSVRPERESWLVILHVDSDGVVAPLYPASPAEARPLAAGVKVGIPAGDTLQVFEPLGTDLIVAIAYSRRPDFLNPLVAHLAPMKGPSPVPADSPLYRDLLASLRDEQSVAVATLEIETMPALTGVVADPLSRIPGTSQRIDQAP